MAVTPPKLVSCGYFRVHLYLLMGINTLATLIAFAHSQFAWWPPCTGAVLSYIGSVVWLYEKAAIGKIILCAVAGLSLAGAILSGPVLATERITMITLSVWDIISSGLLLGTTLAAMLLGHWYLNTPTMKLQPLRRLVLLVIAAVILRMIFCAWGLFLCFQDASLPPLATATGALLILRWLAGLIGTLIVVIMTWATLKIPNTQSATGILYVGVIGTFVGELASQLLSVELVYPV